MWMNPYAPWFAVELIGYHMKLLQRTALFLLFSLVPFHPNRFAPPPPPSTPAHPFLRPSELPCLDITACKTISPQKPTPSLSPSAIIHLTHITKQIHEWPRNKPQERLNSLLNIPPAIFLASPLEYMALEARLDAWLNLSQREKATVFVMVRMRAITVEMVR
jgi:hypothetical protein